ncbi:hypothetical protein U14_04336 [Candidatus Moduliflexus flocculans]|uniref:Uncharacterized protein n=1 Tax=Candidatus Moduliflexus flocculans TaxID=1499966 RepID=A0A0S6W0C3_9BACT|nr:hypothetical protein U14_04336 [Candidatus Moduliflexus flocculans]
MKFAFRQGLIWIPIEVVYGGQMIRIEIRMTDQVSARTPSNTIYSRKHHRTLIGLM